jgi:alpha-1,2-glucosyltransferase
MVDNHLNSSLTVSIIHPFLLADNRHYVFYLFRWVFIPFPIAKYLVTPVYLVAGWAWLWRLSE